MMEGTWGFVTWQDVASEIVQGERATFYYMPTQLERGWAGNAQRMEVRSFRAGRVISARDKSARLYVEFVLRGRRKQDACVQRSTATLVILDGWDHPDVPDGRFPGRANVRSTRHEIFAPEWRNEMDTFLSEYLRRNQSVVVIADYRDAPASDLNSVGGDISEANNIFLANVNSNGRSEAPALSDSDQCVYPDEVSPSCDLREGECRQVLVNAYERNPEARRRCIVAHGTTCCVCGFAFGAAYGNVAEDYIHIHHLRPLSVLPGEYVIDPIRDLRPVCPNCHAVLHMRKPPFCIEDIKRMIYSAKIAKQQDGGYSPHAARSAQSTT